MKYILLVYLDEHALSESERNQCYVDSAQLAQDLNHSGQYIDASPLHLTSTATSVRLRNGKRLVTDGPFAETREQLVGYYLIDSKDLDEAIDVASRVPVVRIGTIEIRPVMEIPGLPSEESDAGAREKMKFQLGPVYRKSNITLRDIQCRRSHHSCGSTIRLKRP